MRWAKPDSSYVNRCSTHQVFTNVGGFAVGEILVDYGLEIPIVRR
jgi:hypothetical protein